MTTENNLPKAFIVWTGGDPFSNIEHRSFAAAIRELERAQRKFPELVSEIGEVD